MLTQNMSPVYYSWSMFEFLVVVRFLNCWFVQHFDQEKVIFPTTRQIAVKFEYCDLTFTNSTPSGHTLYKKNINI